jgi:hypothetical protein
MKAIALAVDRRAEHFVGALAKDASSHAGLPSGAERCG